MRKIVRQMDDLRRELRHAEASSGLATWVGSKGDAAFSADKLSSLAYTLDVFSYQMEEGALQTQDEREDNDAA
jgi:hypothetical protein